jgi:hypothetical protein
VRIVTGTAGATNTGQTHGRRIIVSSTPSEKPEELLDEQHADDAPEVHPAGKLAYFNSVVGMRVMLLAGLVITIGIGAGTDGWGGSTCC